MRMAKFRISTLILIGITLVCCEKKNNAVLTSEESDSQVILSKSDVERIDSLLDYRIKNKTIPGAVAFIAKAGQTLFYKGYGQNDPENNVSQEKDDIFRIASMTKAITAVGALMLFEEGKFSFDDPVSKYIPAFGQMEILMAVDLNDSSFTAVPAQKEMLVRHIFTHTSGIGYGFQDDDLMAIYEKHGISEGFEERPILLKDNIETLAKLPLLHEPGEKYTYSLSYDVLGYLLEIWSGLTLDQFFQTRIFDPLGMKDAHFYLPKSKFDRLPEVYMSGDSGILPTNYPLINYPKAGAKMYLSGGADISCTALDYAKFAQMILNGGMYNGSRILKKETINMVTTDRTSLSHMNLGHGFGVVYDSWLGNNRPSLGSHQWGGFFSTICLAEQKDNTIIILLLQMYPFEDNGIHEEFQNLVYELTDTE